MPDATAPTPSAGQAATHHDADFQGQVLDAVEQAVIATDVDGTISSWNRGAERLYGWPAAEVVGRNIQDVTPTEGSRRQAAEIMARLAAGEHWSGAFATRRRDGSVFTAWVTDSPIRDAAGNLVGIVGVSEDLAERRRGVTEHLAAEREAILAQLGEGIIIADPAGRITFVNEAARRIHGRAELGVPVEGYADAYHLLTLTGAPYPPEDLPLARAVRGDEAVPTERWRIRRPDGSEVVAEGSAAPILAADGSRLGAVLALRDVTAVAELDRQKDEFLASVAHDLGNPLAAVKGHAQLLARRLRRAALPSTGPWLETVGQIEDAATQMAGLVEELLDLGRLQLGQALALHRQPADLAALARRVVAEQRARLPGRVLRLEGAQRPLVGQWDAARLERALANLLGNAVKYSPQGGEVTVRLADQAGDGGRWAVLSVQDRGVGIPAAELPHLFERFRRGSNVVGRVAGTGIGLATVRQIVEQHGGTVTAESVEGEGSTFTIRLPLADEAVAAAPAKPAEAGGKA